MTLKSVSFNMPQKELNNLKISNVLTLKWIEAENKRIGNLLLSLTLPAGIKVY